MSDPYDILLITWNRLDYVKLTLPRLLSDPEDFRLYWWDNASTDGAYDYVMACKDERIVMRYRSEENVKQAEPTRWFLRHSRSDLVGKIDDDILVPNGWAKNIVQALRENEQLGMLGCWTFWMEDFERNREMAMRKVVKVGRHRILQNAWIGGAALLLRKQLALKYLNQRPDGNALPINKEEMSLDGYISGWYFPLIWVEHMDDPRSAYCLMNQLGGMEKRPALTAKLRGIKSSEDYKSWMMSNADLILRTSVKSQLLQYRQRRWRNHFFPIKCYRAIKTRINKVLLSPNFAL